MSLRHIFSTLVTFIVLISSIPMVAQESLGDAARRIRAEKAAALSNASQPPASSKVPQTSQPVANPGELWQATFDSAEQAMGEGEFVQAEALYRKLAAFSEKSSPAPSNIAYAYDGLGSSLQMQRKYADSEAAYRTALQYWSKAPAQFEEMTARSKAGLGTTLVGLARYAEAEQLLLESVNTYHQHPEAQICAQSIPLDGLAQLYRSTHDVNKGERVYTEAFALITASNGHPCGNFVSLLDHLAALYADNNQWENVEKVQQGAISLALNMQGPRSEIYGDTLLAYAQTLSERRRFDEAASTAAQAAKAFRDAESPNKLVRSLEAQELNLTRAGKAEEAKKIHAELQSAVTNATQTGEAADPMMAIRAQALEARLNGDVEQQARLFAQEVTESKKLSPYYQIIALNDSAMFHQEQKQAAEAESELKQALELSISSTGASSDSTAHAHFELASLYKNTQRWSEAEEHYNAALSLTGPQDTDAVKLILPSLAAAYMGQNKLDKAEGVFKQMLKNAEDSNNVNGIAGALEYLAIVYQKSNRTTEAEAAATRAMKVTESLPKPMNIAWGFAALTAANIYAQSGKQLQAEQLYVQVIDFMEKNFGTNHPAVRLPMEKLVALLKSTGKSDEAAKYQARIDKLPPMPPMPMMPGM